MSSLSDVVRALADRPGVEAVVVASMDGLPIAHEGRPGSDPDAVAALAATAIRHASQLVDGSSLGQVQTIALEGDHGTLLVVPASPGSWLLVLVEPDANFGRVLFDLRRHRTALATLL
jgi:predicted regulator of Ras-like GTPase activity (Roadblock/LC7/MglB family)